MPPIEQSLRGSLLTGASALALSMVGHNAEAQVPPSPPPPPQWIVWVEGSLFQTGGGGMNVPSLPGLTAPFSTVGPTGGLEGAAGFDFNYTGPFHVIFDFRYGKSRTASTSTQSHSSSSTTFTSHPSTFRTFFSSTTTNSSSSQTDWEHESHFVADLMIGRDFGLGATAGEIELGLRIADLTATAWARQSGQTTTTFFSSSSYHGSSDPTSSSSQTATGTWRSQFFGGGPRAAVTGTVPLSWPAWSVDYEAGIAGLVGTRSFDYSIALSPGGTISGGTNSTVFVFNTDGWAGLSYALTPVVKITGGIRADYYTDALTTYNSSGALTNVDRLYWGPFLRLTGAF